MIIGQNVYVTDTKTGKNEPSTEQEIIGDLRIMEVRGYQSNWIETGA